MSQDSENSLLSSLEFNAVVRELKGITGSLNELISLQAGEFLNNDSLNLKAEGTKMIVDNLLQCCRCKKVMKANLRESKVEKGKSISICPFCKSSEFQPPKLKTMPAKW